MLKKTFFILILFLASLGLGVKSVSAHILKTDGDIGAVLHIDPDDSPIAGASAKFFFDFQDIKNKFTVSDCSCTATLYENSKQIYSTSLITDDTSPTSAFFSYTFPKKDVYTLKLVGKTISSASFGEFTLTYDLRVDRDNNVSTAQDNHFFLWIALAIGGVAAVVLISRLLITSHQNKTKGKQNV